jgi:DNA-binding response OmpR family regulator
MKVKELIVYKNITYKPNSNRIESEEIDLEATVFKMLRYLAVKESKKWYEFWK